MILVFRQMNMGCNSYGQCYNIQSYMCEYKKQIDFLFIFAYISYILNIIIFI